MAINNLRMCVLEIVNEVRRKLGINTVTVLTGDKTALVLLQFLNEVITECSDFGDWPELFQEVSVLASAGVADYSLPINFPVQSIYEVAFDSDPAPLEYREINYMRVLERASTNNGTPRQFTIKDVDSKGNPRITVHPTPTTAHQATAKAFDVALYKKPELLTTNNVAKRPEFPANLLIQGLYAYALLDENSGQANRTSEAAFRLYYKIMQQALNRYTTDTGSDVYFTPTGYRR